VVKTFLIGLIALIFGLYFVTDMAPAFTQAANSVFAATQDKAAQVPEGFSAGALDFASSLYGYAIFALTNYLKYIGAGILVVITVALMYINHKAIVKSEKN
jgi:PTS system galactitol-specific IIC component